MARRETEPIPENVLLVEGKDDYNVIKNIVRPMDLTEILKVAGEGKGEEEGGYSLVRQEAKLRLMRGDHKRLGIIVDADADVIERWKSLRQLLIEQEYSETPLMPQPGGTIVSHDLYKSLDAAQPPYKTMVGIWLMPDNTLPGALENFVRFLVPAEKEAMWKHAEASVAYLTNKPEPLTDNWRAKACIHTYLAWQKEPGSPMGLAITKKYLTAEAEVVAPFLDWIRRLFEIAP